MSKERKVRVLEVVGDDLCVSSSDGSKLYDRLSPLLKAGEKVILSFLNVKTVTSAFFNAGIAPLYGEHSEETLKAMLILEDLRSEDEELLARVVDNAIRYHEDPAEYMRKMKEALES